MVDPNRAPHLAEAERKVSDESFASEVIHTELERRIEVFDKLDDAEFGRFTRVDWTICTFFFFVLPILISWWAL